MALSGKVLLVDDHELVRIGVKTNYSEVLCIAIERGEALTLHDVLEASRRRANIDAVLLDLNLGDCKDPQGLRLFMQAHPQARVAVVSGTQDAGRVHDPSGPSARRGCLHRQGVQSLGDARHLVGAAGAGSAGLRPMTASPALFPRLPRSSIYARVAKLGPRHQEILELVSSGRTNQEISQPTQLSLGTVKSYESSLLLAQNVRSRPHFMNLFR